MSKKRGFDKGKVSRKIGDLREEKSDDKRGLERRKVSTKRGLERGKVDLESHHAPRCHHLPSESGNCSLNPGNQKPSSVARVSRRLNLTLVFSF